MYIPADWCFALDCCRAFWFKTSTGKEIGRILEEKLVLDPGRKKTFPGSFPYPGRKKLPPGIKPGSSA